MRLAALVRRFTPARFERSNQGDFPIRERGQHLERQCLVRLQPFNQFCIRQVLALQGCYGLPTQYFVKHIQQRSMSFWLQSVDGPDQPAIFARGGSQIFLHLLTASM